MQYIVFKTWSDDDTSLDEKIANDLQEARDIVAEHDGICEVIRIARDVENREVETTRDVTHEVVNMLKAEFESQWFDYPEMTVHPLIADWANEFWQEACAEDAA